MSEEDELRAALDEAADEIARVESDPRPWQAWVVYLLKRLELKAVDFDPTHQEAFDEMLAGLRDTIRDRLRTGGW